MHSPEIDIDSFNPRILFLYPKTINSECRLEYHSHGITEFRYVLSERFTIKINDVLYHAKRGDIIICNPGALHVEVLYGNEELHEIIFGIDNFLVEGLLPNYLIPEDAHPIISPFRCKKSIALCCDEILYELQNHEPFHKLTVKSLMLKLISLIYRELNEPGETEYLEDFKFDSHNKSSIVNTILAYINENYMKEISLNRISNSIFLSPVYISRIFKEETGDSLINFLTKIRLNKAKELLVSHQLSVKEVAKAVGYPDAYYFSKLFKKYYGYPPSKIDT